MNPQPDDPTEDDILHTSVRQIVLSRETIPRSPRWARAFRRTLLRFVRDIAESQDAETDANSTQATEETPHDPS
jgi:hypothetical protein